MYLSYLVPGPEPSMRQSIRSLPDDSMLPPPMSQSSAKQKSKTKRRKCSKEEEPSSSQSSQSSMIRYNYDKRKKQKCSKEQEEEPLQRVTPTNSSATDDSSLIPNSQTSFLSECNVVEGKRSRKKKSLMKFISYNSQECVDISSINVQKGEKKIFN